MKITKEQLVTLHQFVNEWTKIALNTEPADFCTAKNIIKDLYRNFKLNPRIRCVESPVGLNSNKINCPLRAWSFNYEYHTSTLFDVYNNDDSDREFERLSFVRNMRDKALSLVANIAHRFCIGGSLDSRQLSASSLYEHFRPNKLEKQYPYYKLLEQYSLTASLCWLGENTAIICDRPKSISIEIINNRRRLSNISGRTVNNTVRLHNTSGPAIEWRDGIKHWYIEGIEVDEQIVMNPETQTIKEIDNEWNEERRRIRIERYGWLQYLENSGAKLINSRINERDNQPEKLYSFEEVRNNRRSVIKRFACIDPSTGRKYVIAVPRKIRTCLAAQKYLSHGLDQFAIHRS